MVHKKYTYKDGKRFGPYYYETKRVNGEVVTTYLGTHAPYNNFLHKYKLLILFSLLFFSLAVVFVSFSITGHVSLDIKTKYNVGELIEGKLNLNLVEGEFVPADSKVIVSYAGESKEFLLSSLIADSPTRGEFYAEGLSLIGEGLGFGLAGKIKEHPLIDFKIELNEDDSVGSSESSGETIGAESEPSVLDESVSTSEPVSESSEVSQESQSESSESQSESSGITGSAISDSGFVSGKTSKDEPFIYELADGQTGSLVEGSVSHEGNSLEDKEIDLKIKKNELTVSTDYFIEKEGYGEDYIGNGKIKISIDLSVFDFVALNDSEILVVLDYNGEKIVEVSEIISVVDSNVNEIEEVVDVNDSVSDVNETIGEENETETVVDVNDTIIGNLTDVNETLSNITLTNQTISNLTEFNQTVAENMTNVTGVVLNESAIAVNITQFTAVIGQPVHWIKRVAFDVNDTINLIVQIPASAENITLDKINLTEYIEIESLSEEEIASLISSINKHQTTIEQVFNESNESAQETITETEINSSSNESVKGEITIGLTGQVISGQVSADINLERESLLSRFFKRLFGITGRVTDAVIENLSNTQDISINLTKDDFGVEVEYYTGAPVAVESVYSDTFKTVFVSSPDDVHYENVLVFTNISDGLKLTSPSQIEIEWVENDSRILDVYSISDLSGDGYYDYVSWVAPHLSNQTFNIIVIINALHLNETREFISNIYNETRALDDVWSESIPSGHYVRVTFEINLTSLNDITIYPRATNGTNISDVIIDVFENNGSEVIARFNDIVENTYNKVYLTNLTGEQDTFDLHILNGGVEFDHIVDPQAEPNGTKQLRAQTCVAMADSESSNNYVGSCTGTYPAQCPTDLVSCNDGSFEDQSFLLNMYSGIKITSFNSTIANCGAITGVTLCYEWWTRSFGPYTTCPIYVDSNDGASESSIGATCPSNVANPGRTCVNVTTLESWKCENFFGGSGTRAYVRTEVLNDIEGGGDEILRNDLLMFNVTYLENIPPGVFNLTSPVNGSSTSARSVNVTLFVNDTDSSNGGVANLSLIYIDNALPFTNEHLVLRKDRFAFGSSIYFNYSITPLEYSTGMFLLYHFDNNTHYGENLTRVTDFATANFNGTYTNVNGDRENSLAGLGLAFEVDSNERISLSDNALLDSPNVTGEITIMAWINMSTNVTADPNQWFALVSKQNSGVNRDYLFDFSNSSKKMTFSTGNGTGSTAAVFMTTNTIIYPNISWYHVALTYNRDSGNTTFYINGVVDKSQNLTAKNTLIDTSASLTIGGANANSYFPGLVDDVAIYNRTLNSTEILDVYRLKEGTYYLRANVTDPAGGANSTNSSPIYTFYIDATGPNVTLNDPANASSFASGINISFNWTAIDSIDASMFCNLTIGSNVNQTNIASANNTMINGTVVGLSATTHYWNVSCLDDAGNRGNSVTRTFTVNGVPYNGTALIMNSTLGLNRTLENINVRTTLLDLNNNTMNVTVRWYNRTIQHLVVEYNSSYANGTTFIATLGHGNTTKGQNWTAGLTINDGQSSFTVNSSNITILNAPPNVTLVSPINGSITLNRTSQTFTWESSDDDGDVFTLHRLNFTLMASSVCLDSQHNGANPISIDLGPIPPTSPFYNITQSQGFNCLSDNNDYYKWSVSTSDGTSYGPYSAPFNISVQALLSNSMNISLIEFGSLGYLGNNDTVDNSPKPFIIVNNGNVLNDISIYATSLWQSVANPSSYYQAKIANVTTNGISENGSFLWSSSQTNYFNISLVEGIKQIINLNYTDATDSAEIDINVTVPSTEGPGARTSTITFTITLGTGDTYVGGDG